MIFADPKKTFDPKNNLVIIHKINMRHITT
jgi:hypothetical protein